MEEHLAEETSSLSLACEIPDVSDGPQKMAPRNIGDLAKIVEGVSNAESQISHSSGKTLSAAGCGVASAWPSVAFSRYMNLQAAYQRKLGYTRYGDV